ncbi:MAG: hypothetical protein WCW01_06545, partial [Gammaproteobacteria bacterium]
MKSKFLPISLILVLALLSGCAVAPERLGISEATWNKYPPAKQKELRNLYYQAEKIREEQKKNPGRSLQKPLFVTINDGKVLMPPFTAWSSYQTKSFVINKETCLDNEIKQLKGDGKIALRACYQKGILYLDPSQFEQSKILGTTQFLYNPLWEQGVSYKNINTAGYVKLKNATVTIQELPENYEPKS